jgi:hypothetical protein
MPLRPNRGCDHASHSASLRAPSPQRRRRAQPGAGRAQVADQNEGKAATALESGRLYVAVLLPDGDSLVAVRGAAGFATGRLSQLAALPPLAAGVTLPTGFAQSLEELSRLPPNFDGLLGGGQLTFTGAKNPSP